MVDHETPLQRLPWLPVLETGHEIIDEQHRHLIDDANEVYELIAAGGDWARLTAVMGRMHRACAVHFAEENKLRARLNFSDAAVHALEHKRLLERVDDIHALISMASVPTLLHRELATTLRSLLLDHLLRYDLRYKSHIMYFGSVKP